VAQEGVKAVTKHASQLSLQEAQMILGVKEAVPWEEVMKVGAGCKGPGPGPGRCALRAAARAVQQQLPAPDRAGRRPPPLHPRPAAALLAPVPGARC
jgi:hypothetical protein